MNQIDVVDGVRSKLSNQSKSNFYWTILATIPAFSFNTFAFSPVFHLDTSFAPTALRSGGLVNGGECLVWP